MSVRILSLFGDEPIDIPQTPEEKKVPARPAKKAPAEKSEKKEAAKSKTKIAEPTAEKQYYGIGEISKMFKVRTSHIRFWTNQFDMKVRTNRKGDRLYNPENIEQLRLIHHLVKVQGFTIAGAKAKLKEIKKTKPQDPQTTGIAAALKEVLQQLKALRDKI